MARSVLSRRSREAREERFSLTAMRHAKRQYSIPFYHTQDHCLADSQPGTRKAGSLHWDVVQHSSLRAMQRIPRLSTWTANCRYPSVPKLALCTAARTVTWGDGFCGRASPVRTRRWEFLADAMCQGFKASSWPKLNTPREEIKAGDSMSFGFSYGLVSKSPFPCLFPSLDHGWAWHAWDDLMDHNAVLLPMEVPC
ncbi:hypothetical protein BDP55DRAFT_633312 [Colletotrichum godetiae]|uniref:Uncharacterized protein n=1 Tax=Colletotrichum godetiae TaxID=1209918 RepID=A0AAJ0AHQ3_9PEZI|nr:uncharacterized protein BDP55DRAFT_633312 [Colletotrichum godetiae]KAK1674103.1 hypothetical protein BDP55DRAFT_633312 [Colletotrichum godetiae]